MNDGEIRESLQASINALADDDWRAGVSGSKQFVFFDPSACTVYHWSHVGAGWPEPVWAGRHKTLIEVASPLDVIPASMVSALTARVGMLVDACVARANDDADADIWQYLDQLDLDIRHYWDPGDWYQDSGREIEELLAQGHSADQIVDQLDQGDDYNGRIRVEAAVDWMTDRVDEILAEAVDAIGDADDAEQRWDAVSRACALHRVPLRAGDQYVQVAAEARDRGHASLGDALTNAHCAQVRDDQDDDADLDQPLAPGAPGRQCYGCGVELSPHAGLSVAFCGRCGDK